MYLLDTNVLSELRRPRPHGGVIAWFARVPPTQLFVCAFSLGEIQAGAERTRRQDPQKAADIEAWLDGLPSTWEVISMDGPAFREWARLMAGKSDDLFEDALIAATASVRGLTVVTRNVRDFQHFPVPVLNPFSPRR
jgi:predicted nucleic acid-binding protein